MAAEAPVVAAADASGVAATVAESDGAADISVEAEASGVAEAVAIVDESDE